MNEIATMIARILIGYPIAQVNMADWPAPWPRLGQIAAESEGSQILFTRAVEAEFNGSGQEYLKQILPDEEMARQGESETTSPEKVKQSYPPSMSFDDLKRLPSKEWLAKGLFGPHDFVMIFGRENRGKTFVTCDLIMSLISGQSFAGLFEVTRPCRVYYCTDEGRDGIPARFAAAASRHGLQSIKPEQLRVNFTVPQLFDQNAESNWRNFIQGVIDELGDNIPDVLILDTLFNATVGARENVSDDASIAIAAAKMIRDILGCTVLLIHHSDKGDNWPRGTSAWMGSMDLIMHVDTGKVSCFKAKDAPKFADLGFELTPESDSVAVNWTGKVESETSAKMILAFLQTAPNQKFSAKEIAERMELSNQTTAKNNLEWLARNHENVKTGLKDPAKAPGSWNPKMWWLEDKTGITFENLRLSNSK